MIISLHFRLFRNCGQTDYLML